LQELLVGAASKYVGLFRRQTQDCLPINREVVHGAPAQTGSYQKLDYRPATGADWLAVGRRRERFLPNQAKLLLKPMSGQVHGIVLTAKRPPYGKRDAAFVPYRLQLAKEFACFALR
jgi:hypothetical protein